MRRALPEIAESLETLETLLSRTKDAKRKRRIHLLVLLRSGEVRSRGSAAKHLAVHRNSVGEWLSAYESGGLDGLLAIGKPGAKPGQKVLSPAVLNALKERLQGEGFEGYKQVRKWLRDEFGLEIPYTTVYGLVRFRLASKLKRARPQHVKKTA
ncbi:MAG: orfA [Gemmatimonadetes bacterium]|nr:orfA [Gemmatimonadota bacterium]